VPAGRAAARAACSPASRCGASTRRRFYGLRLGGRLVSSWYGFHAHGICYAYLTGFEPGTERLQPGTLLVGHAIEAAEREGLAEFDFLRGQEPFKYFWGAIDRPGLKRVLE
jgi:CelD/BcsL family acetyltransferase involved in cellulose biosynthesis